MGKGALERNCRTSLGGQDEERALGDMDRTVGWKLSEEGE